MIRNESEGPGSKEYDKNAPNVATNTSLRSPGDPAASAGVGWLFFAGTILGLAGVARLFDALWAFGADDDVSDNLENALLGTSVSNYGRLWIAPGLILIWASFAIFRGSHHPRRPRHLRLHHLRRPRFANVGPERS